ncbi:hypothetical protein G5714_008525 [Onychostoma macrolepis]|uniref:Uncharacterized protein n=1 Tax=Onychostoma macrolepis TaxID=369639 RepID=A0A7J6CWT8_9TELE|nr:hypothetical protein G5714_008525 [Onychostoma macrolepis]
MASFIQQGRQKQAAASIDGPSSGPSADWGRRVSGRQQSGAMSSSSGLLAEELQCSVCLDVFTDPVSTPCGHNFCKSCLNQCWNNSQECYCPFCKETFRKRPDLKINTALRQVVQLFQKKSKSEVLCDVCEERKHKALKSCLLCQASYCETHLEFHHKIYLKRHKLLDPVKNMKNYICQKHERPLELFCRDDQTRVCVFCTDGDHKTHNIVPLEKESEAKKTQLMKTQKDVQQMILDRIKKIQDIEYFAELRKARLVKTQKDMQQMVQDRIRKIQDIRHSAKLRKARLVKTQKDMQQMVQDRIRKIQDIRHSAKLRKKSTEREKAANVELFSDLMRSIERCQAELLEMMEEKQKAAEKQEEKLIHELEQEITELKMRSTEMDHLLHTEDHLQLLQIDPSLCSPPHTRNWPEISMNTDVSVETLRRALTRLQETLDQKLSQTVLMRMQQYADSADDDTERRAAEDPGQNQENSRHQIFSRTQKSSADETTERRAADDPGQNQEDSRHQSLSRTQKKKHRARESSQC